MDRQLTVVLARVKAHAPLAVPYMQQTYNGSLQQTCNSMGKLVLS